MWLAILREMFPHLLFIHFHPLFRVSNQTKPWIAPEFSKRNQGKEIKSLAYQGPERTGLPQQHHSSAPVGSTHLRPGPRGQVPVLGVEVLPRGCLVVCLPFQLLRGLPRVFPACQSGGNARTHHSNI